MTIASKLIDRALYKLRVASPVNPAPAETTQAVYDELVSMLEAWEKQGYNTGILVPEANSTDTETDLAEPLDVTDAIVNNLAVKSASLFGKAVDPQLKLDAERTRNEIEKEYRWLDAPELDETDIVGEGNLTRRAINIGSFS